VLDYSVIGCVQLAAMVYGLYIVAGTRPVYVAFSLDRLEVVTAFDIKDSERALARDPRYLSLPWNGPRLVSIKVPKADYDDALWQSLEGNEEHQRHKFYVPYEDALEALAELKGIPADRIATLPVRHINGFWTALIDTTTGMPVSYVAVDPYGD
jgi:hypothetical protein